MMEIDEPLATALRLIGMGASQIELHLIITASKKGCLHNAEKHRS